MNINEWADDQNNINRGNLISIVRNRVSNVLKYLIITLTFSTIDHNSEIQPSALKVHYLFLYLFFIVFQQRSESFISDH